MEEKSNFVSKSYTQRFFFFWNMKYKKIKKKKDIKLIKYKLFAKNVLLSHALVHPAVNLPLFFLSQKNQTKQTYITPSQIQSVFLSTCFAYRPPYRDIYLHSSKTIQNKLHSHLLRKIFYFSSFHAKRFKYHNFGSFYIEYKIWS